MQNGNKENNDVMLMVMSFMLIICSIFCVPLIGLAIHQFFFTDITGFAGFFIGLGTIAFLLESVIVALTCFLFWSSSKKQ